MSFEFDPATHTYTVDGETVPSVTEILAPLTVGKYPPNAGVIQQAAARGTRIHELCALYDMDALPEEFEADLVPYVQAWANFCRDYQMEWLHIEKPLHDEQYVAGTLDRLGRDRLGYYTVVDIKTAQSLDRPAKIALACQLYGYQRLAKHEGLYHYSDIEAAMGVQLLKTGDYRVYHKEDLELKYGFDSWSLFTRLLEIYDLLHGRKMP